MKNGSGFTLIELLVVVLIIGILAAIAVPQYMKTVEKSRAAEALLNIKPLKEAADRYYLQTGAYPLNWTDLDIDVPGLIQGGSGSGNSMINANFEYRIFGPDGFPRLGGIAVERVPAGSKYYLYYEQTDAVNSTLHCKARTDEWRWLCQALGGVYVSGGAPNIIYKLR